MSNHEAPRVFTRGIFTHGKCKAFSGQSPKATGSEIGLTNFAIQKPQGDFPLHPHKNFAPFIPAFLGGAFWRGFCKLSYVVDVSKITGFSKWLVNIYNQQRWLYGLIGLVLVGIIALILSFLTEWIMGKLGYKCEGAEHRE